MPGLWRRQPRRRRGACLAAILFSASIPFLAWFSAPPPLDGVAWSRVAYDRRGGLLAARMAADQQFRFPPSDSLPARFREAVVAFEDKRFYRHPGVDALALGRALWGNLTGGAVSGASTITMQVVRAAAGNPPRTLWRKAREMAQALRLDRRVGKDSVLRLWAALAPFGGNVAGLDAACWRYFGRPPASLSWAEAALLAVLPNAPSLMSPARRPDLLLAKRDRLLRRLRSRGLIDDPTLALSLAEEPPAGVVPFPAAGRHLLLRPDWRPGRTTIDPDAQRAVEEVAAGYGRAHRAMGIAHMAALVVETATGRVAAYMGNLPGDGGGGWVDIVPAPRSPGSALKPLLYAAMAGEGELLPGMLLPDVPLNIDGYAPRNFDGEWSGALPAAEALVRSANVPFVTMLRAHGVGRFHGTLRRLGITTLSRSPGHYGLSLILGGAEVTLWDLAGAYASLGRVLLRYGANSGRFQPADIHPPRLYPGREPALPLSDDFPVRPAGIWQAFEAMTALERPDQERGWRRFASSRRVAWKTGTSFGFRDAWAVGVDPLYTVAVWVGNADGAPAPGLVGLRRAAPVMFDIFRRLDTPRPWFPVPYDDFDTALVCRASGHLAGDRCPEVERAAVSSRGMPRGRCPYHVPLWLDAARGHRSTPLCAPGGVDTVWFVLPPAMEHYYRRRDLAYAPLPPDDPSCPSLPSARALRVVYPHAGAEVLLPPGGALVARVSRNSPQGGLFWYLDGALVSSGGQPEARLSVAPGPHSLYVVDSHGNAHEVSFVARQGGV